jgi:hypothetical protein
MRASAAQLTQSSSRSATPSCGLLDRISLAALGNRPTMRFTGDGTVSSTNLLVPRHMCSRCSASVSNNRMATVSPSATSAG